MKTVTVSTLKNGFPALLQRIQAGEEIMITQHGKPIARLVPLPPDTVPQVDWSQSPELRRDRSKSRMLSAEESLELIREAGGKW